MKKALLSLFMFSFIFTVGLHSAYAQVDRNCNDFDTWEEVQTYFEQNGGSPTNNVDDLDGNDRDGLVCESLPGAPDGATWSWDEDRLLSENAADEGGQTGQTGQAGQGGQLPATATNYYNLLAAGVALSLAGSVLFFRKKRSN